MSNSQNTQDHLNRHVDEQFKKFGPSKGKHKLSRSESLAAGAQPYFVFVSNITGEDLNGWIYFVLSTNPNNIQEVALPVPNNAQTGFQLGGSTDCNTLEAYRLILGDQNNNGVADTGAVSAHQNPATPCVDAYVITAQ